MEIGARHERIHVEDQHRLVRAVWRREDEQIGQVQARIVIRKLEHRGTEVVGHLVSLRSGNWLSGLRA
jgi:hypothetical protein